MGTIGKVIGGGIAGVLAGSIAVTIVSKCICKNGKRFNEAFPRKRTSKKGSK